MRLYNIRHKVGYLVEDGPTAPKVLVTPDPIFQWEQRRTILDETTLVLAFTISEDGKAQNVSIVSPGGMGLDDDAAEAVAGWRFSPGQCDRKPCAFHARAVFQVDAPNTRAIPR